MSWRAASRTFLLPIAAKGGGIDGVLAFGVRRRPVPRGLGACQAGTDRVRQVFIRLGSQVTIPGKIMQMMRPNNISPTNGIADL